MTNQKTVTKSGYLQNLLTQTFKVNNRYFLGDFRFLRSAIESLATNVFFRIVANFLRKRFSQPHIVGKFAYKRNLSLFVSENVAPVSIHTSTMSTRTFILNIPMNNNTCNLKGLLPRCEYNTYEFHIYAGNQHGSAF